MKNRGFSARRTAVLAFVPFAAVLSWTSLSWACGLFATQPFATATPNRATAPADVTVAGSGWQTTSAISLNLTADGSKVLQPLAATSAGADGAFSTRVRLAVDAPGLYYVSASQGDRHVNIPVEVTGLGRSAAAPAWSGLDASQRGSGLSTGGRPSNGSDGLPLGALAVGGGVLTLCGALTYVEIRRKRAAA